ncbi:MAG: hypothetical protein PHR65_05695 [Syntrophomonadaceae bacterium]|nr:hypothetical protein [Syntrophomonadaceae bacterium]MDD3889394.1 hypothetical protein [Syntrophomonadaceae bacterium]
MAGTTRILPAVKDKKIKRYFCVIIVSTLCGLLIASCGPKSNDGPPDSGKPVPPPHSGTFVGEYGSLTFNGDGETVHINLNDDLLEAMGNPPNDVDYTYYFKWYNFGPCPYDVAPELSLYHQDSQTGLDFSLYGNVTETCITFSHPTLNQARVKFEKQT